MVFHSRREYGFFIGYTVVAGMAVLNPTTATALKGLCVLAFIGMFYFALQVETATIQQEAIHYTKKLFAWTISERLIHAESIERVEKIKYTLKLYEKGGKHIHFAIHSPEFIAAVEAFCAQHCIPMEQETC